MTSSKFNPRVFTPEEPIRASLLGACLIALGACAPGKVSQSAATFGTKTAQASSSYIQILDEQQSDRQDDVRQSVIRNRVDLLLTDACDEALFDPAVKPLECDFGPATALSDIPIALRSDQLRKLARALEGYGAAIAALSGDFSEENEALLTSLTDAGSAAVELEATLRGLSDDNGTIDGEGLNAAARVIAQIASAGLQLQRDKVLLDLIEAADRPVQDATSLLSQSMVHLKGVRAGESALRLEAAMSAYDAAVRSGAALAKPYDNVASAVAEHQARLALNDPFADLGKAHAQLRDAANGGLSASDFEAFVTTMISVAQSVDALSTVESKE